MMIVIPSVEDLFSRSELSKAHDSFNQTQTVQQEEIGQLSIALEQMRSSLSVSHEEIRSLTEQIGAEKATSLGLSAKGDS